MAGKRALITGVTGFVGSHLAELLLKNNVEVYGTRRWRSKTENIDAIIDKIKLLEADLRDDHSMLEVVREVKPEIGFEQTLKDLLDY
jgi:GDP-4-dehydro-6-deoxy-D-mannose reductase